MDNKQAYRALCAERNDIPLFLHDWWLDAVCNDWDVAIVKNGDHIAGAWPYRTEHKLNVSIFRNPVLTPYLGPHIFYPHDLKESKRDNFEHETTEALLKQVPAIKVWTVSLLPGQQQLGLFKATGFDIVPRQTFIMPLEGDEETVFARLHEDYRRNIRKAQAEMTITHEPDMLPQLWEFQKATLDKKDVQMHFSLQQLQTLFEAGSSHDCMRLWAAKKEGVVQAILWHMWDAQRAYYLVGSKNPAAKDNRAMTALIWNAIKESQAMGKLSFDFEGSMDAGVEKFFRNFGGQRTLYMVLKKNDSLLWKAKEMIG